MGVCRTMRLSLAAFLIGSTGYLYVAQPDWWIYGIATGLAGLVNLISAPKCPWWRLATSLVIVLGTLEALFLAWSIRAVEQAPFLTMRDGYSARDMLPEGRYIVLVALGVTLTIATRLGSAEHGGPIDCLRTLLLLGFAAAVAPAAAYSLGFYVPPLAGVITHYLEQYHL